MRLDQKRSRKPELLHSCDHDRPFPCHPSIHVIFVTSTEYFSNIYSCISWKKVGLYFSSLSCNRESLLMFLIILSVRLLQMYISLLLKKYIYVCTCYLCYFYRKPNKVQISASLNVEKTNNSCYRSIWVGNDLIGENVLEPIHSSCRPSGEEVGLICRKGADHRAKNVIKF